MHYNKPEKISLILSLGASIFFLSPYGGRWAWLIGARWFYVLLFAFCISYFSTGLLIYIGHKLKILDHPDYERKIHTSPVPRIGGLGIFVAITISTLRNLQFSKELTALFIGSLIIYMVGFIDDIKPQKASLRLFAQITASLIALLGGVRITVVPVGFPYELFWEYLITILWLVGLANAINFLDGINGLASGLVGLSSILFFTIAFPTRQSYLAYLTMALVGGCAGFFLWNIRGKIFLGDAGATFIGFLAAGIAVMGSWTHPDPIVAAVTPLLVLSIPIFDMIYTTISRFKNRQVKNIKEWLEYVGKDHLHHRLMNMGFSDKSSLIFVLLLNLAIGLGAITIRFAGNTGANLLLIQTILIFVIVVLLMLSGRKIVS